MMAKTDSFGSNLIIVHFNYLFLSLIFFQVDETAVMLLSGDQLIVG